MALGALGEEKAAAYADQISRLLADTATVGTNIEALPCMCKPNCAAAAALGRLGKAGKDLAGSVAKISIFLDIDLRCACMEALGNMGEKIEVLLENLGDFDKRVRVCCLDAFVVISKNGVTIGKTSITRMSQCLADPEPAVREHAALALSAISGVPIADFAGAINVVLDDISSEVVVAALKLIASLGKQAALFAVSVSSKLEHPSENVRAAACTALGEMQENGAQYAEQVARKFLDPSCKVRRAASAALGDFGVQGTKWGLTAPDGGDAIPYIVLLRDKFSEVRAAGCEGLQKLSASGEVLPEDVHQAVQACKDDEFARVRAAADKALKG